MYQPNLGRWLTLDPSGLAGGDVNFYRAEGNDPITGLDPSGLIGDRPRTLYRVDWASRGDSRTQLSMTGHFVSGNSSRCTKPLDTYNRRGRPVDPGDRSPPAAAHVR